MPLYVPLDVNFPDDEKVMEIGLDGAGLYAMALCVAKRLETDGRLTRQHLYRLGADDELIDRLVSARTLAEDSEGLWIRAWLKHNDSVDELGDRRAKDAQRKRLSRKNRPADVQTDAADASENVQPLIEEKRIEVERSEETERAASNGTSREVVPIPKASQNIHGYPADFLAWWNRYPKCEHKVGKGDAAKAFQKAKRAVGLERLTESLAMSASVWAGWPPRDQQYIPKPSTWLNEGRYDDPPPLPRRNGSNKNEAKVDGILEAGRKLEGNTA